MQFIRHVLTVLSILLSAQTMAQDFKQLDQLKPSREFDNVLVFKVTEDSLQSCFVIWIKEGVKAHYHAHHSENIVVLEGEAMMSLGDELFMIKKGDFVNIPKGTPHSVTQVFSDTPLKVLSIQSPMFDGTDRVFVKND